MAETDLCEQAGDGQLWDRLRAAAGGGLQVVIFWKTSRSALEASIAGRIDAQGSWRRVRGPTTGNTRRKCLGGLLQELGGAVGLAQDGPAQRWPARQAGPDGQGVRPALALGRQPAQAPATVVQRRSERWPFWPLLAAGCLLPAQSVCARPSHLLRHVPPCEGFIPRRMKQQSAVVWPRFDVVTSRCNVLKLAAVVWTW